MGWSKRWKLGVEGGEDLITLRVWPDLRFDCQHGLFNQPF